MTSTTGLRCVHAAERLGSGPGIHPLLVLRNVPYSMCCHIVKPARHRPVARRQLALLRLLLDVPQDWQKRERRLKLSRKAIGAALAPHGSHESEQQRREGQQRDVSERTPALTQRTAVFTACSAGPFSGCQRGAALLPHRDSRWQMDQQPPCLGSSGGYFWPVCWRALGGAHLSTQRVQTFRGWIEVTERAVRCIRVFPTQHGSGVFVMSCLKFAVLFSKTGLTDAFLPFCAKSNEQFRLSCSAWQWKGGMSITETVSPKRGGG